MTKNSKKLELCLGLRQLYKQAIESTSYGYVSYVYVADKEYRFKTPEEILALLKKILRS